MTARNKIALTVLCLFLAASAQAQKKVTYGKSTFTVYVPLPDLAPTPACGFVPDVPGYTLKSPHYGPKTYYAYAPGVVPKTAYQCILTEIRDWVFYRPDDVKACAEKRGLKAVNEKTVKRMFKGTRLPDTGLMYALSDSSWLFFGVTGMQNCGPREWGSNEPYVTTVSFIERVPQDPKYVLDKLYRFWNDGARFGDTVGLTQSNFNARPTAPTDQNPNNFAIGDVLNPQKGFYRLSFAGGAPTYVWHSYEKVVADNLKRNDFDAMGSIDFEDLLEAFDYELNVVQSGKNIYFCYSVQSRFLADIKPGRAWQKEMDDRKSNAAQAKAALKETQKANAAANEKLYREIFK